VEGVGTAHLTSDILAQRAVGASVSRRQITDVLHDPDGTPELVLDFAAAEGGEHATISMTWSRDDLERLLEAATGDEVRLMFDRDELESALGDTEAHGLRARAAVFAVAAAGALGSGATIANAAVLGDVGGGAAATPTTATSTADASAALEARSEAMNQEYGLGAAGDAAATDALQARSEAMNQEYGLGAAGEAAATDALQARSEALNQELGLGAAGDAAATDALQARSEAMNQEYGLGAAGEAAATDALQARSEILNQELGLGAAGDAAATDALRARSEATNQEYGLGAAGDAAATDALQARSEAMNQEYGVGGSAAESAGGLTLDRPTAEDALLIGGMLLTIAGATFAVRRTAGGRPA
jgi:hypothetical protein